MPENPKDLTFLESPHVLETHEVLKHYGVNVNYGLNEEQVIRHRNLFGSHTFVKPKKASLLYLFITQFDDLLVKILLLAALISFLLTLFDPNEKAEISSFIEPIVILFILVLNALVGVWQEANAEKALEALNELQPTLATCLRGGIWSTFETEELVVGDIVKVKNGDKIPSDLRLVQVLSTSLLVEQSQLTGESFLIYKTTEPLDKDKKNCELQSKTNILFGSTTVCSGSALGVVVATGMKTEIGAIQSAVIEASTENTTTPLQIMLNEFGTNLSKAITVICVLVWAINFRNFKDPVHGSTLRGCIYYFKIAIALAVAAIPEGLPAVITTCLALGTRKMAKRNAIVRKLPSIETLGCTTVICSDKTGTLTTNKMTSIVVNMFDNEQKLRYVHMPATLRGSKGNMPQEKQTIRVTMGGFGDMGLSVAQSFDGPVEQLTHTLLKCASLCSDVTITTRTRYSKEKHTRQKEVNVNFYSGLLLEGEPTEVAIIEMVNNLGRFLLNCDTSHLDDMGKLIYGEDKRKKSKKKYEDFNGRKSSSEEELTETEEVSLRGSFKDDAQDMGMNDELKSPTSSRESIPKRREDYPTSLLYRKYLQKEATLEFCRSRKMMTVIAKDETKTSNNLYIYTKGAPESVLEMSINYMRPDGTISKLGKEQRQEIQSQIRLLAGEALRVLAFAYREGSDKDLDYYKSLKTVTTKVGSATTNNFAKIERDLVFLGLVGIMDPPRPEVKESIRKCMRAGIRVIMITGDNKITAEAIARKIGIIRQTVSSTLTNYQKEENFTKKKIFKKERDSIEVPKTPRNTLDSPLYTSLTGKEFESMSVEEQKKLLSGTGLVFSRTEPKHKQNIVAILKELGEIVAMTGDGVNDAPALKMADIGISMGINGTEVAKEASDMILADDNFRTIVSAVEEGRCIYSNMKAFIRYLISSNIGEVVSIFMTAMLGIPEGMLPVQLLWVNLVTDGPPATALGFNPPDPLVMKKDPRASDDKLIDKLTLIRYLIIGFYVGISTCGIFIMYYIYGVSPREGNTLVTFKQLRDWGSCQEWAGFKANNIYEMTESCEYFTLGKLKASTLSLTTLVTLEMFNAFNALSEDTSLLITPPWKNMYLIIATVFSMFIHFLILYIPFLSSLFNVVPLDRHDWKWVLIWSFPVILIDEAFKFGVRWYKRYTKPKLRHSKRKHHKRYLELQSLSIKEHPKDKVSFEGKPKQFWKEPSSDSFGSRFSNTLGSLLDKVSMSMSMSYSSTNSESMSGLSSPSLPSPQHSDDEMREAPKLDRSHKNE